MNVISIFFASLAMASTIAITTVDNGDVDANGLTPETVTVSSGRGDYIPPPQPPVTALDAASE